MFSFHTSLSWARQIRQRTPDRAAIGHEESNENHGGGRMADDVGSKDILLGCTFSHMKEIALERQFWNIPQSLLDSGKNKWPEGSETTSETLPQDARSTRHPQRSKTVFTNITFIKACGFILEIKFNNPTVLNLLMLFGYWLIPWCSFG